MKKISKNQIDFRLVFKGLLILTGIYALLAFPELSAAGVKNGIFLVANRLVPALFPFMVLSTYIGESKIGVVFATKTDGIVRKIFKTSGVGLLPFILGALGGYPVGAKVISHLYNKGELTRNEAERLFYWCINPSPSFAISAVGTFMLGSTKKGLIIYFCCISASLTVGIFCRFLGDGKISPPPRSEILPSSALSNSAESNFVNSVSSGSKAMLNMAAWVIVFSALGEIAANIIPSAAGGFWIKTLGEVTAGSEAVCSEHFTLPVISAVVSFGGFAVICQILGYSQKSGVQWKRIFVSRLISCALATVYTGLFTKLFPEDTQTLAQIALPAGTLNLYHSIPSAIILVLMCITLILEVDKSKKVC